MYIKKYVDEENWIETDLEDIIEHTEGSGFWKPDTVEDMLEQSLIIRTPFCEYKKED